MLGLVPGIHVFEPRVEEDVDGQDKPGHPLWIGKVWAALVAAPRATNLVKTSDSGELHAMD